MSDEINMNISDYIQYKIIELAKEAGAHGNGTPAQALAFIDGVAEGLKYVLLNGSNFGGSNDDVYDAIESLYNAAGVKDE